MLSIDNDALASSCNLKDEFNVNSYTILQCMWWNKSRWADSKVTDAEQFASAEEKTELPSTLILSCRIAPDALHLIGIIFHRITFECLKDRWKCQCKSGLIDYCNLQSAAFCQIIGLHWISHISCIKCFKASHDLQMWMTYLSINAIYLVEERDCSSYP